MRRFLLLSFLLGLFFTADQAAPAPPPGSRAAQWKKIDKLLAKEQTASAAPLVTALLQEAKRQNDVPNYVRALLYRVRLLERRQEDADEKAIVLLEQELKTATFPARPILHSLLGSLYTQYLNQNRYRLYQRTAGAEATTDGAPPNGDVAADGGSSLATWDMGHLGAAIVRHYRLSVEDQSQRQLQTTLAELGDLALDGDAEGRALRPTLFDLLAHRAISGLQNQELYVTRPEQQFQATQPGLFGTAAEFAALQLQAPAVDSLNGQLHALRLLQRLTAARLPLAEKKPAALADVDLLRLDYLHGLNPGPEQEAAYDQALAAMAEAYRALPISTGFLARQVELRQEPDPTAAVQLALVAESRFPRSAGAARARWVRQLIQQPALQVQAEDVVVPNQPGRLSLSLRNVRRLHGWACRLSLDELAILNRQDAEAGQLRERIFVREASRRTEWTIPVPAPAKEYQRQQLVVPGPALAAGHYLVVLSSQATNPLAATPGQVSCAVLLTASELSALTRSEPKKLLGIAPNSLQINLLVLHRQTGQRLPDTRVLQRTVYYRQPRRHQDKVLSLNADAEVLLSPPQYGLTDQGQQVLLVRGADTLQVGVDYNYYPYGQPNDGPARQTFLFTDRAIYRPGQTVYFKGVLTEVQRGQARLLAGQPLSLRLLDVNGQAVQTLSFTTSEFGSFHGSLVLPTGLLNGEMQLTTDYGSVAVLVEDYKRPTFSVRFDSVTGQPALGQPLQLRGQARAYAGQPVDGATVQYRVQRRVYWPFFDYGWRGRGRVGGGGVTTEVAHGQARTDAEGRFTISFTPTAERQPPGRWRPGYVFEVSADVTTAAGETRTGTQSVSIGEQPMQLRLELPALVDRQHPDAGRLFSTNAVGTPTPARGTLRILARQFRAEAPGLPPPFAGEELPEAPAQLVQELPFDTNKGPGLNLEKTLASLPAGRYRVEARVSQLDSALALHNFTLYDSQARTLPYRTPDWVVSLADTVAPGQPATLLLGSAAGGQLLLEVEQGGQLLRHEWLSLPAGEQRRIDVAAGSADSRPPLLIHTAQVRDNRFYRHDATVVVREAPHRLTLTLATFRDRLQPGQRETWRLSINHEDGQPADAELLATLYDQSLDAFRPHRWAGLHFPAEEYPARYGWTGQFLQQAGQSLFQPEYLPYPESGLRYPVLNTWGALYEYGLARQELMVRTASSEAMPVSPAAGRGRMAGGMKGGLTGAMSQNAAPRVLMQKDARAQDDQEALPAAPAPDLTGVTARSDFRETALWEPALRTDKKGSLVLEFQMPEAVTRWQLLALAHDKDLRSGQLARQLVTQKQVQMTPNAPRFLRQGDTFTFPASFANLTDQPVAGTAQLFLLDAATGQDLSAQLLRGPAQQTVAAAAHQSVALGWEISLPTDFTPTALTYRVVAQSQLAVNSEQSTGSKGKPKKAKNQQPTTKNQQPVFTDGEENTLPVLPNRILVTESLPLPIVGPATREFELRKLSSTSSPTRRNYALTLELTPNPAWYAVQSLPYLMEYPYESADQVFNRLYANLIAGHLLRSNPRFRTVLREWQRQAANGTAAQKNALASKLEQNQELKNLLLQETPWVRDAQQEDERLARLGGLFDSVRTAREAGQALAKLQQLQHPNGAWPWFEKMPDDRYVSQLIVAGFGKLQKLGAFQPEQNDVARAILDKALRYLDENLALDYARLRKQKDVKLANNHLDDLQIQALYARSFWTRRPVSAGKEAYDYYRQQAAKFWPGRTRYLQAQLALALSRDNRTASANDILRAMSENALHSPELGMYWKDVTGGYYWREAPTETQATLIEAYHEVKNDQRTVDELKLWLLKQKQTHSWASNRATADACYALLLRGSDWLAPTQPLQITVGGEAVRPVAAQAGTGYFKTSWPAAEVQPAQGKVSITKPDAGVAWGALYWQYYEDLDKITPAATPLSLERQLYREKSTATGPVLEKISPTTSLKVGEVLVVRVVLRTDRALEYVHLKDQRAAGLELVSPLSGYRYQNGLGYYESPRDAATNFFLAVVPRGTHVFEYRLRAAQAGDFSSGLGQVQCLYAPEFGAQSAGSRLRVTR